MVKTVEWAAELSTLTRYVYNAKVVSVYDADTIKVDISLGMGTYIHKVTLRLAGINAPEVRGVSRPEGLIARDWLRKRIMGKRVVLHTFLDKRGKYGRYMATVYIDGVNVNKELLDLGYAVLY